MAQEEESTADPFVFATEMGFTRDAAPGIRWIRRTAVLIAAAAAESLAIGLLRPREKRAQVPEEGLCTCS